MKSVDEPSQFLLQANFPSTTASLETANKPRLQSAIQFYVRLGFTKMSDIEDNRKAMIDGDEKLAKFVSDHPNCWIYAGKTSMAVLRLDFYALRLPAGRTDLLMVHKPKTSYATFPVNESFRDIEKLANGLELIGTCGQPLFIIGEVYNNPTIPNFLLNNCHTWTMATGFITKSWREAYSYDGEIKDSLDKSGISLLLAWTVRNEAVYHAKTLIVPIDKTILIACTLKHHNDLLQEQTKKERAVSTRRLNVNMNMLETYIYSEPDIWEKVLIIYVQKDGNDHWNFTAAVNAGTVIEALASPNKAQPSLLSGYIHVDTVYDDVVVATILMYRKGSSGT